MKWFISQPMKNLTNEEIESKRKQIVEAIRKEDPEAEIIDSFFKDVPHDAKPLYFLAKSLEMMSKADICYFAKGWKETRGCVIENKCANEYGYTVVEEH